MWIYCKNDIEIECEHLKVWDKNPNFMVLTNCTVRKKITSKKGIPQIILNNNEILTLSEDRLGWHELQRIR